VLTELRDRRTASRPPGRGLATAALIGGLLYSALSVYWGLRGAWLLDTLGGSLERAGRTGYGNVMLAVWAAAALKGIAAVLPMLAVHGIARRPGWDRAVRALAWTEAAVLTGYGLILTSAGVLTQTGTVHTSPTADHHALAWHAYLWDPWFLLWGLLVTAALVRSRRHSLSSNRG